MAIKNNYWRILNKTPRCYYTSPGGWEIHVNVYKQPRYSRSNIHKPINNIGQLINKKGEVLYITKVRYDIPRECPKVDRKSLRQKIARDKRIAQSVTTKEEYQNLWKRIDEGNWEYIEENDLKDEALVSWAYNTRTADEYYRLLRYN